MQAAIQLLRGGCGSRSLESSVRYFSVLVHVAIHSLRGGCESIAGVNCVKSSVRLRLVRSVERSIGVKFEKD
jgi:hypothetical protein